MSITKLDYVDPQVNSIEVREEINLVPQVRKSPLLLYGIFLHILERYYSNSSNMLSGVRYRWVPDHELVNTKEDVIIIKPDYSDFKKNLEHRPGIVVKIGDIVYSNLDGGPVGNSPRIAMDVEEGEYHYARKGTTTVAFDHIGSSKGEALLLASNTLDYLDAFSDVIKKDFCFELFGVKQFITNQKTEDYKDKYISTIVADIIFQDIWTLKLESPKLKNIVMDIGHWADRESDECINKAINCC